MNGFSASISCSRTRLFANAPPETAYLTGSQPRRPHKPPQGVSSVGAQLAAPDRARASLIRELRDMAHHDLGRVVTVNSVDACLIDL